MIYSLVRPIAALALKIFFRKIYFTHRERLPKGKPMILAINHPTAFIEPCICACFLPVQLYFLVRGDLFKKPLFRKMLNILHMVPIYRMKEEGFDQLKKNDDTFRFCYDALNEGKTIVILPEGKTIQEKRLRPIKKGLARIAFGTYEKYGDIDLQVVPLGVNYTEADKFRSVAMFEVGTPIPLREYYDMHAENPKKAIRHLTAKVKGDLENLIVNIPNKEDEYLTEAFFTIYRNGKEEKILPIISENRTPLQSEMKIATGIFEMETAEKEKWIEKIKQYNYKLESNGIDDFGVQQNSFYNFGNTLLLILGFIPYFIGFWINYPVFAYPKYVSDQRVKQLEFKAAVALAVGLGLSIITVLVLLIVGGYFIGWWILLVLLGMYYLGKFSLAYLEFYEKWKRAKVVGKVEQELLEKLKKEREVISAKVNTLI